MNLADTVVGTTVTIEGISGDGSFRRRLFELGMLPGTEVTVVGIAPLRDPMELRVRGGSLSIRRTEATQIVVDDSQCRKTRSASESDVSLVPERWLGSMQ